jgi:uncharacterized membrane protein
MPSTLKPLLETQMTRRQFLVSLAGAVITLVGMPAVLKAFSTKRDSATPPSSTYGHTPTSNPNPESLK